MLSRFSLKKALAGLILCVSYSAVVLAEPSLLMTEVADPSDVYQGRYVEFYSVDGAGEAIGQYSGKDIYLAIIANKNNDYTSYVKLTGETIGADGFFIVCRDTVLFQSTWYPGVPCDLDNGSVINNNGDDSYVLFAHDDASAGLATAEIIDIYGTPGYDPPLSDAGNVQDGHAERLSSVSGPNSVFDVTEWSNESDGYFLGPANPQGLSGMTPRSWEGAASVFTNVPTYTAAPTPATTPATTTACTSIEDIQGNGADSPLVGQVVRACGGRITSFVRNGFYMQDPSPYNEDYSSGIFVYTGTADFSNDFSKGNMVIVTGGVSEYYGNTQISANRVESDPEHRDIVLVDATTIQLPVSDMSVFEKYEGMYVSIESASAENDIVFSEYYNFDRYGEVLVCDALYRWYQFSENNRPDVQGQSDHSDKLSRSCVTIDDNKGSTPNPAYLGGIFEYEVSSSFTFRGGDVIDILKGPLYFSFGKWRVQPMDTSELSFTPSTRPEVPTLADGDVKLVFANLLNYWTEVGTSSSLRGADSPEEFARQKTKTSLALSMMDADVVAVCELQNNNQESADDLLGELNARFADGSRVYATASKKAGMQEVGGDVIRVDVFYDTKKIKFIEASQITDADIDYSFLNLSTYGSIFNGYSRVPLVVTLRDLATKKKFNVVVTHFKSKGDYGGGATGEDADKGDGAANYNYVRTLSTLAVKEWIERKVTAGKMNKNTIVIGDMNAYGEEDPILAFGATNFGIFYNAIDKSAVTPRAYSYLYDGQFGSLDHAFVSAKSYRGMSVADAKIWNINSDEPDIHDYNTEFGRDPSIFDETEPYRFSDHDPILMSLKFECNDSPWREGDKTCLWVGENPTERCSKKYAELCPWTCGNCKCQDEEYFVTELRGKKKTCAWIAKNPQKRCKRIRKSKFRCEASCRDECQI